MASLNSFKSKVFQTNIQNFEDHALELFRFQASQNQVYSAYLNYRGTNLNSVREIGQIPFLPIRFFKSHKVVNGRFEATAVFESSGTTGMDVSKHYVEDLDFYHQVSERILKLFFGDIKGTIIVGLLPSYLERGQSSLVAMVQHFINRSGENASGFYLRNYQELRRLVQRCKKQGQRIILFGVTFALLELASQVEGGEFDGVLVIETGGMKGRGREMIRAELHDQLTKSLGVDTIYSEYGMTELMSQAYLEKPGFFRSAPWMRVMIRDLHDPYSYLGQNKTGGINIIDLANVHSCAFIETEDLGAWHDEGFEVLGRMDNSDIRGCNLMVL